MALKFLLSFVVLFVFFTKWEAELRKQALNKTAEVVAYINAISTIGVWGCLIWLIWEKL